MIDPVAGWYGYVASHDRAALDALLSEDVVLHSPAVHTPIWGKPETAGYVAAIMQVLGARPVQHIGEWREDRSAVIEFCGQVDQIEVHGVNLLHWDADGRIVDFTMMIRPLQAIHAAALRIAEDMRV